MIQIQKTLQLNVGLWLSGKTLVNDRERCATKGGQEQGSEIFKYFLTMTQYKFQLNVAAEAVVVVLKIRCKQLQ